MASSTTKPLMQTAAQFSFRCSVEDPSAHAGTELWMAIREYDLNIEEHRRRPSPLKTSVKY